MIEVSREYTKDGSIYIMPAGSLYTERNLSSYIEALARVDINSTDTIIKQIIDLIINIKMASTRIFINPVIYPSVLLLNLKAQQLCKIFCMAQTFNSMSMIHIPLKR